jgi:chromosome segregation ATPase
MSGDNPLAARFKNAAARLAGTLDRVDGIVRATVEKNQGELEALRGELAATALGMARHVADLRGVRDQLSTSDGERLRLQAQITDLERQLDQARGDAASARSAVGHAQMDFAKLVGERDAASVQAETQVAAAVRERDAAKAQLLQREQERDALRYRLVAVEGERDSLRAALTQAQDDAARLRRVAEGVTRRLDGAVGDIGQLLEGRR